MFAFYIIFTCPVDSNVVRLNFVSILRTELELLCHQQEHAKMMLLQKIAFITKDGRHTKIKVSTIVNDEQ